MSFDAIIAIHEIIILLTTKLHSIFYGNGLQLLTFVVVVTR